MMGLLRVLVWREAGGARVNEKQESLSQGQGLIELSQRTMSRVIGNWMKMGMKKDGRGFLVLCWM